MVPCVTDRGSSSTYRDSEGPNFGDDDGLDDMGKL